MKLLRWFYISKVYIIQINVYAFTVYLNISVVGNTLSSRRRDGVIQHTKAFTSD